MARTKKKTTTRSATTSRKIPSKADPSIAAIILAAGEGTRMKSRRAKVLHEVCGRTLIEHVVQAALGAGAMPVVVVVGVQAGAVRDRLTAAFPSADLRFVEQPERKGTGDAVRRAEPALAGYRGDVLILCGDVPALDADALRALREHHVQRRAALTVLSAILPDPTGYGRMVRGAGGRLMKIVEHRDATRVQQSIAEINTGTYCADWGHLVAALARIRPDNAQGEYYLTDAVRLVLRAKARVVALVHPAPEDSLGVNSRQQLAEVARTINLRILNRWMTAGVTIIDPATTWIDDTVEIGPDTVVHPGVTLTGKTVIGRDAIVRSGSRLADVVVGDGAEVLDHVVATSSEIGPGCHVGPFAHLRPGTRLAADCKLGNFVETKKATFGRGSKASHLSYVGDAQIGERVNIGAGTITCNYDGVAKHQTTLEDGVFIGSDTQLVAPVTVGAGAYVGAGTTVTRNVPPGALALSRTQQRNIEGWVARRKG